jgi:hypothetical protein
MQTATLLEDTQGDTMNRLRINRALSLVAFAPLLGGAVTPAPAQEAGASRKSAVRS